MVMWHNQNIQFDVDIKINASLFAGEDKNKIVPKEWYEDKDATFDILWRSWRVLPWQKIDQIHYVMAFLRQVIKALEVEVDERQRKKPSKTKLNDSGVLSQRSEAELKSDVTMEHVSQQTLTDLMAAMAVECPGEKESNVHMDGDSQRSDYLNANESMEIFGNVAIAAHGLQAYLK